jgi:hypothetical protein
LVRKKDIIHKLQSLENDLRGYYCVKHDGIKAYYQKEQGIGIVECANVEIEISRNLLINLETYLKSKI